MAGIPDRMCGVGLTSSFRWATPLVYCRAYCCRVALASFSSTRSKRNGKSLAFLRAKPPSTLRTYVTLEQVATAEAGQGRVTLSRALSEVFQPSTPSLRQPVGQLSSSRVRMSVEQALIFEPRKIAVQRTAVWYWPNMAANFVRLKKGAAYREYR